jgi:hypothetical protein
MYKKTIKEAEIQLKSKLDENGNRVYSDAKINEHLQKLNDELQGVIDKYEIYGGNPDDLEKKQSSKNKNILEKLKAKKAKEKDNGPITEQVKPVEQYVPNFNDYDPDAAYDIIPLPSNGECYPTKMKKATVAFLDARDENIIISPNLYQDGKIFDVLLRRKVFNNSVDVMDMLDGDREAIILYLRVSGFGNEYPIVATDKKTGTQFNTVVDLSSLKYKPFNLVADENGFFDYTLQFSKKKIKFKFLTHRDVLQLAELNEIEVKSIAKKKIEDMVATLNNYADNDATLVDDKKTRVKQAINELDMWQFSMETDTDEEFSHSVTNRVELQIVEVEGNRDREFIHNFVEKMNMRDLTAFIKYVKENEPGIDYNIEVEKPESLGGGSMPVFLQLDQYVFLNTTL